MPKPRTVINEIVFKNNNQEMCNWLYFIYHLELKVKIYPYMGKPYSGYITKNSMRNLTLPKGMNELMFIKTKGSKRGVPLDFDNLKVIGFPNRLDNKVQQYIYDKLNEKGISLPNGYSCWSMVSDLVRPLRRYSGNVISLDGGTQFTFPDYGYYAVPGAFSLNTEEKFSTRKTELKNSIIQNKGIASSPSSILTDEEVKTFCNELFPTA